MNGSLKILFLLGVIAQFFVPVLPQLGIGETIGDRAVADGDCIEILAAVAGG